MPTQLFSQKQRAAFDAFPETVSDEDCERFFTLSDLDRRFVGRFGEGAVDVATMLGALRMLGFVPSSLTVPDLVSDFVVEGLATVSDDNLSALDLAPRSQRDRIAAVFVHAGWRRPAESDLKLLDDWLLERAMEHDGLGHSVGGWCCGAT